MKQSPTFQVVFQQRHSIFFIKRMM